MIFKEFVKCSQKQTSMYGAKWFGVHTEEIVAKIFSMLNQMSYKDILKSTSKITIEIIPCVDDEALEIWLRSGNNAW